MTDENAAEPATAVDDPPKARKKASRAPRRAPVAPKKAKSAKKAIPAKKGTKGAKKANAARAGSKTAKVLDLLKRSGGVTMKELMKATGWHRIRSAAFCRHRRQEDGCNGRLD